jgi:phosphoglucosamine mutase
MSSHIFRAYDIRGVFNQELDVAMAARIGMAFGSYLGGGKRILVARDGRTSSEVIEEAFIAGLASTGCDCVSIGLVPIPTANYHVWRGDYDGGAYVTASHNPPEYGGIRFRHSDGTGYTRENMEIRDICLQGGFGLAPWDGIGGIDRRSPGEAIQDYLDFILGRFSIKEGLKAVLDLGNGVAATTAPEALRRAGIDVATLNEAIDGRFPGRPSEPKEETLGELMRAVVKERAAFGAGYDGDADRVIFVDDRGRVVQTEKIGVLIARDILKRRRGKIIANVECSMIVEEEIPRLGGEVLRVRVGDVFISEAIKKHGALFAMETSAHYFMPEFYPFDDPLLITLKLGEILSRGEKLSDLVDAIPSYPKRAINFPCRDEEKFRVVEEIVGKWKAQGYTLDLTDGAKVVFSDGWALLRPSNTTPLVRATLEGASEERLQELVDMVTRDFKEAYGSGR